MDRKAYLASLPKKRIAAGCFFFDVEKRILLLKPGYKPEWEIPGGVAETNESPLDCCRREVWEEIGLTRNIGNLFAINYNAAMGDETEWITFIFRGGVLSPDEIKSIQIDRKEIIDFNFFSAADLPVKLTIPLRNRIMDAWQFDAAGDRNVYYENSKQW